MTHPAYTMARLNAKNARFDIGSGGIPELTVEDVSGGLGFVPCGVGRELLCRVWWPAGAELNAADLDQRLIDLQFGEWRNRMDALVTAQIREQIATGPMERRRGAAEVSRAQQAMWPRIDGTYALIRKAVVRELVDPRRCTECKGRGSAAKGELISVCQKCTGSGKTLRGTVWRAMQLKMRHQSYRALWEAPYEWMFAQCNDALCEAVRLLSAQTE